MKKLILLTLFVININCFCNSTEAIKHVSTTDTEIAITNNTTDTPEESNKKFDWKGCLLYCLGWFVFSVGMSLTPWNSNIGGIGGGSMSNSGTLKDKLVDKINDLENNERSPYDYWR